MTDPVTGAGVDLVPPIEPPPDIPNPDDTAVAPAETYVPAITGWRVVTPFDLHAVGDVLAQNDPRGPQLASMGLVVGF